MLLLNFLILLLLILINGFFAMAEIALVSARRARLQPLANAGDAGAQAALELKADPSRLLATVQIGLTIIAVLSGTFGEATLGEYLQEYLSKLDGWVGHYAHVISMAIVVIVISYVFLILGELVPKRVALIAPETIARSLAGIMRLIPMSAETTPITDEEIGYLLREGAAAGQIPQAETAIVEMALRLGDRRVSAVMTPRTQIEFLDLDDPEEETRRRIRESSHSRFPVVEGGTHQLVGVVQVKDLFAAYIAGQPLNLRAALRAPLFLPNTVTALRALEVLKSSGEPMALVVDEYGDLEGLVTLTDILQALVGDIQEAGETDPRVVRREDGTWLIDGMISLDELKQVLGVQRLPGDDADFHTLGGYLMAHLNRVPMIADRVTAGGYSFEVVDMDGRRVDRVLVSPVTTKARRA
jgi:putative hemolysin